MIAERVPGNYTLLKYTEPSGDRRLVASYVLEGAVVSDVYAALTEEASAARWCAATSTIAGELNLAPFGAPAPLQLLRASPIQEVEFAVAHVGRAASAVVVTLAPAARCTDLAVSHRGVPVEEVAKWVEFWSSGVFLLLANALQRGADSARPALVKD